MKPTDAELIRAAFKRAALPTRRIHTLRWVRRCWPKTEWYIPAATSKTPAIPHQLCRAHRAVQAVSEGVTEFTDIAIVGSLDGKKNTLVTGPCGVCRQALYEFCGPRLRVLMAKSEDDYIETTLGDLLPYGFGPTNLEIEPGAD